MDEVEKTLTAIGRALEGAHKPWWVIGAAAVMLHRPDLAAAIAPADVDVLLDPADAPGVLERLGLAAATDGGTSRFRSALFVRWEGAGAPSDLMAGFEHRGSDGVWRAVTIRSRARFMLGDVALHAPDARELAALLTLFGRPKDLARRALLESARLELDPRTAPPPQE